jgi:hypothetical protein
MRRGDMWCVLWAMMLCVCELALCWLPWLPLYLETVEGGGGILCAYSRMLLEGCIKGLVGIVVCGAFPHRDAWVRVHHFVGMQL